MKTAFILIFLFANVALGATDASPADTDDDFSPMIFAFALGCLCILLFIIGAGIAAAGIMVVCAAILAAFGIVSCSVFIGILRRRFLSGLRAFHYQIFAAIALPAGVGALWFGSFLLGIHLHGREILVCGAIAGICGGLLLAFTLDRLAGIAHRRLLSR